MKRKGWNRDLNKIKGEIGLLLVSVIWGSGFIASAIGLDYLSAEETLAGRFFVASVILALLNGKRLFAIRKETWKKGIILGGFLYLSFILQTIGLVHTTPSKNAFLTAVNVALVPFVGFLVARHALNKKDIQRAFLSMVGVAAISLEWSGAVNVGDLLSLLCAVTFAFHIHYTGLFSQEEHPLEITFIQMFTAFILGTVVMLGKGDTLYGRDPRGYLAVLYLGVFSTTIAFLVQTASQRFTKSSRAAVIMSTESLFAMIFSILFLKESVTLRMVIGALIIFTAIILPQESEEKIPVPEPYPLDSVKEEAV